MSNDKRIVLAGDVSHAQREKAQTKMQCTACTDKSEVPKPDIGDGIIEPLSETPIEKGHITKWAETIVVPKTEAVTGARVFFWELACERRFLQSLNSEHCDILGIYIVHELYNLLQIKITRTTVYIIEIKEPVWREN